MMNIILVAPPAAGKGTQAKLISTEYNIPHISTGDLLRSEVQSGSTIGNFIKDEMDSGNLISDDIIINLIRERIMQVDCKNGYILDGFPRNVEQAIIYDNMIKELGINIGVVISMDISQELAIKRTMGRIVCSACGTSYNKEVLELKPKIDGFCDKCGHTLKVRSDDNVETAKIRFNTFLTQTKPLIEYYRNKGVIREIKIDESTSSGDVFNLIKSIIG